MMPASDEAEQEQLRGARAGLAAQIFGWFRTCGIGSDVEGRGHGRAGAGGAALAVEPEGISRLARP